MKRTSKPNPWMAGLLACVTMGAWQPAHAAQVRVEDNRFDCVIRPYETVSLVTTAEGVLVEVSVDRGDRVREGQLLARIDSRVEEATVELAQVEAESDASVESARASLAFQKARLKRNRDLAAKNMVSQEELEEIETQVQLAELNLRQAEVNKRMERLQLERAISLLELRKIFSPFDGLVMDKLLNAGEYVDGDSKVLTVARMDPLRVEAYLPAAFYTAVVPGIDAEIYPSDAVGGVYSATVADRDNVLNPESNTFRVRLELGNPDYELPAGVRCQVRFLPR